MTKANPREKTLSIAVTIETLRAMRIAAAQHDMALSSFVYAILRMATRNFTMLRLTDIEQNFKKENEK